MTSGLFELGKLGLSLYLGKESTASSYGAAAAVVLLLLWVYYTSCILFLGAEFTQVYAKATGHVIEPTPNAEPVTAEKRAQEGLEPASKKDDSSWSELRTVRVQEPMPFRVENALLLAATVGVLAGLFTRSTHHDSAGD